MPSKFLKFHSLKENIARDDAVGLGNVLKVGKSLLLFPMVSLECFNDLTLLAAQWPWSRLASNRNEYQEYLADNLTTFMCGISRSSGKLKILQPYGPLQAFTGTAKGEN